MTKRANEGKLGTHCPGLTSSVELSAPSGGGSKPELIDRLGLRESGGLANGMKIEREAKSSQRSTQANSLRAASGYQAKTAVLTNYIGSGSDNKQRALCRGTDWPIL